MDPNTRQTKRAPVTLKIKFKSQTLDQFIERYAVDVSPGGIFIRTKEPLAVGTQMRFEFQLRDATPLITGDGTVVWTRENDPARPNAAPGMGVRFDRLGDGSQPILDRILAEKAKQPQAAQAAAETPKSFMEVPTRVAPSPLMGALAAEGRPPPKLGSMAPSRAGFADERTDNTPLPRPMPFHSDADEFPEETFEEATKVRALDELVAATASPDADPMAVTSPVARHAPPVPAAPVAAPVPVGQEPITVPPVPATPPSRQSNRNLQPPLVATDPAAERSGETTPAVIAPTEQVRAPRPPTSPPVPTTLAGTGSGPAALPSTPARSLRPITQPPPVVPAIAEPMVPPAQKTSSRGTSAVLVGLLLAAAVAAAGWYFFIREKKPSDDNAQPPVTNVVVDAGAVAVQVIDAAPPAIDAPAAPVETAKITIKSNIDGASVEIVETGVTGETPFDTELEVGKEFTVRVSSMGAKPVELRVKGGDKSASAKLEPMARVLHVSSTPPGAVIQIDGQSTGKSTPADITLSRAQAARPSIRVALKKGGYGAWGKSLTPSDYLVEEDIMAVTLDATLTKLGGGGGGGGGAEPAGGSSTGSATPTGGSATPTGSGGSGGSGAGSATPTGSGGSGAGSATPTGSGAGSATPTGGSAGSGGGSATPSGGSATPSGSGSATPSGAGSGSTKPAGGSSAPSGGSAPAGSGSAPAGSGSGSGTGPTPDWMK